MGFRDAFDSASDWFDKPGEKKVNRAVEARQSQRANWAANVNANAYPPGKSGPPVVAIPPVPSAQDHLSPAQFREHPVGYDPTIDNPEKSNPVKQIGNFLKHPPKVKIK